MPGLGRAQAAWRARPDYAAPESRGTTRDAGAHQHARGVRTPSRIAGRVATLRPRRTRPLSWSGSSRRTARTW